MKRLSGICLITQDVPRLRDFYRAVLQVESQDEEGYSALATAGAALSLLAAPSMEQMAPGSMAGAGHGGCALEFEVDDVDGEYARLTGMGAQIVKPPATYPWGRRAVWFRDPDGNIVSFYCPVVAGGARPLGEETGDAAGQ